MRVSAARRVGSGGGVRGLALASSLLVGALAGCHRPACAPDTILLSLVFEGDAGAADTLKVYLSVDGGDAQERLVHRSLGPAELVELSFAAGYPTGHAVELFLFALEGKTVVGAASDSFTTAPGCTLRRLTLVPLAGAAPDGGAVETIDQAAPTDGGASGDGGTSSDLEPAGDGGTTGSCMRSAECSGAICCATGSLFGGVSTSCTSACPGSFDENSGAFQSRACSSDSDCTGYSGMVAAQTIGFGKCCHTSGSLPYRACAPGLVSGPLGLTCP